MALVVGAAFCRKVVWLRSYALSRHFLSKAYHNRGSTTMLTDKVLELFLGLLDWEEEIDTSALDRLSFRIRTVCTQMSTYQVEMISWLSLNGD